jgi:hypothetical protein
LQTFQLAVSVLMASFPLFMVNPGYDSIQSGISTSYYIITISSARDNLHVWVRDRNIGCSKTTTSEKLAPALPPLRFLFFFKSLIDAIKRRKFEDGEILRSIVLQCSQWSIWFPGSMTHLRRTRVRPRIFRCLPFPLSEELYPMKIRPFQTKVRN